MAITTVAARVSIALFIKSKINSTFIGIGGTEPWENEKLPPEPDQHQKEILTPVGYKKVDKVSLCRRIEREEDAIYPIVHYRGEVWELIPDDKAFEEEATFVYFEAYIRGTEMPQGEYRQVGIFTDFKPKEGVTKAALSPEEVEDTGILEFFENRQRHNRTIETNVVERFIISVTERR